MLRNISVTIFLSLLIGSFALVGCGGPLRSVSVDVVGRGAVTPAGKSQIEKDSKIKFRMTAEKGWLFDHWEGKDGTKVKGTQLVVDGNKSIVAVFVKRKPDFAGLEVGRKWVYRRSPGGKYAVEIISKTSKSGKVEYKYGPKSGWLVTSDKRGYHIAGDWDQAEERRYEKPISLLQIPIAKGRLGMMDCKAVGQEQVTVPAGTFNAWRYDEVSGPVTAWFVPYLGWVKIVTPRSTDELIRWR